MRKKKLKLKTVGTLTIPATPEPVRPSRIMLDVFGGTKMERMQDNFMHAGDVFEKGKHLASFFQMGVEGEPDMEKLCENAKNAFIKATEGYVLFIAIREVDGVRCDNPRAIIQDGIQTLSMLKGGTLKWGLFRDILNDLGYKAETDEHMVVKSVSM